MKLILMMFLTLGLYANDYSDMKEAFEQNKLSRALSISRFVATRGDVTAMYDTALLYYAKGNISEATNWFKRSLKNGGNGDLAMAIILFSTATKPKEFETILEYLSVAKESPLQKNLMAVSEDFKESRFDASAQAYLSLSKLYLNSMIVHTNYPRAVFLLQKAAQKGDPEALEMLGDAYWRSNYTRDSLLFSSSTGNNLNMALQSYKQASAAGNLNAKAKLGKLLIIGPRDIRRIDQGISLIKSAAESGNALGAYMMGELYLEGVVTRRNPKVAASWFEKSTDICAANNILAHLYGASEKGEAFAATYSTCVNEKSTKKEYRLLFEKF